MRSPVSAGCRVDSVPPSQFVGMPRKEIKEGQLETLSHVLARLKISRAKIRSTRVLQSPR